MHGDRGTMARASGSSGGTAGSTPADGPVVLLLHGALGNGAQLDPLATRLAGRARVLPVEFEGHGLGAPGVRPYRIEHFAENALEILTRAGRAPVVVVGYSMGGYVGLWLARHHPDRVAALFTLGTKAWWDAEGAAAEARQLDAEGLRARAPRFAATLASRHGEATWPAVVERTAAMMREMGASPPLAESDFAAVACPVRVVVGDRDATATLEGSARLAHTLPAGDLEVLPRTPHPVERVSWDRLAWSLTDFMSEARQR